MLDSQPRSYLSAPILTSEVDAVYQLVGHSGGRCLGAFVAEVGDVEYSSTAHVGMHLFANLASGAALRRSGWHWDVSALYSEGSILRLD